MSATPKSMISNGRSSLAVEYCKLSTEMKRDSGSTELQENLLAGLAKAWCCRSLQALPKLAGFAEACGVADGGQRTRSGRTACRTTRYSESNATRNVVSQTLAARKSNQSLNFRAACYQAAFLLFGVISFRLIRHSAIWIAFSAAPLRKLSDTHHNTRPFSTVASSRMRLI